MTSQNSELNMNLMKKICFSKSSPYYIFLNFAGTEMPAPVTIKGWLYKRGNDGLKLWKKRYFVLSEYCLSYYKGAHDEKASGTILLPSYR